MAKVEVPRELLEEISEWITDNDYECGEQGSSILTRIEEILNKEKALDYLAGMR